MPLICEPLRVFVPLQKHISFGERFRGQMDRFGLQRLLVLFDFAFGFDARERKSRNLDSGNGWFFYNRGWRDAFGSNNDFRLRLRGRRYNDFRPFDRNFKDAPVEKLGWDYKSVNFFFSPSKVMEASCIRQSSTNNRWFWLDLNLRSQSLASSIPFIRNACDAFCDCSP